MQINKSLQEYTRMDKVWFRSSKSCSTTFWPEVSKEVSFVILLLSQSGISITIASDLRTAIWQVTRSPCQNLNCVQLSVPYHYILACIAELLCLCSRVKSLEIPMAGDGQFSTPLEVTVGANNDKIPQVCTQINSQSILGCLLPQERLSEGLLTWKSFFFRKNINAKHNCIKKSHLRKFYPILGLSVELHDKWCHSAIAHWQSCRTQLNDGIWGER